MLLNSTAQSTDILTDLSAESDRGGLVILDESPALDGIIDLQKEVNAYVKGIAGFRVVLFRGSDVQTARAEAARIKTLFLEKYPDEDAIYQEYQQPIWRVLVGDYLTYGEALKMRNQLEKSLVDIKDNIIILPARVKYN